jgi:ABC-type glycerol-3-phosphate transport system substrate-binding protein
MRTGRGFNEQHPDISVQQNPVPQSETAIRIRMVREDVPDMMSLNGNYTFGELAGAGVFHDFSQEPVLEDVTPAILDILNDWGPTPGVRSTACPSPATPTSWSTTGTCSRSTGWSHRPPGRRWLRCCRPYRTRAGR